jgi:AcrR family transcriptional regulator
MPCYRLSLMAGVIEQNDRRSGAVPVPDATSATGVRAQRRHETSRSIEHHALRLFADRGFQAVTADQIATEVGISRRTFFRYFPGGKDEVVLADIRRRFDHLRDTLAGRPAAEPAAVALRHAVMAFAEDYGGDQAGTTIRHQILLESPTLTTRFWGDEYALTDALVQMVALRLAADPATDPRPAVLVNAALAAVTVGFGMWMRGNERTLPDLVDESLGVVEEGISAAGRRTPVAN